ncbi:Bactericidal permeability-increasing protein, alpha/beta domain protein [Cordyceps fumosorosea ARSEF 2679]|uniref:Bactericidal permeability-increasing protein, alpha/beta domain protein n=1 Tax=Cordyceps fumosorosea (strain ARSEF 2679) TaxID=1081104 RepID=A0A167SXT9_CORFA|nr:Bactericidal permeability-increasing protein, alpha/beta domain protein [Cordyceps fumosorosea ARSEF 2679]OAA60041.1 Bactericidal permeability-increasing protein, alpha/beta domain protein [Cordyceps fumosorosea ARSEF 2679]
MLSCFGRDGDEEEREPLLPRYNDDTAREARLHEKLHTYQMLRAISKGFMPSTEQTKIQLRTLLSSQILNPSETGGLSSSGRALVRTTKEWLRLFIGLLEQKNSQDQIQDFIWYLASARVQVDSNGAGSIFKKGTAHAKASAAAQALRTVFSLALLNNDFRVLVADVGTITTQVLRDGAFAIGQASNEAGKQLDSAAAKGSGDLAALKASDKKAEEEFSKEDLKQKAAQVKDEIKDDAAQVSEEVYTSLQDHMGEETQKILINRLKAAVRGLRQKKDYSEAVSQLAELLQRCATIYLSAAGEAAEEVEENIELNRQAKEAATNFWGFISSFGDKSLWDNVATSFREFTDKNRENRENAEQLAQELITMVQKMLSDPEFLENFGEKKQEMKEKTRELTNDSSLGDDISHLINTTQSAVHSAIHDPAVQKLVSSSWRLAEILFPTSLHGNSELFTDFGNIFLPLLVQAVQHLPIPRLEVATPTVDLLLENLILQPGKTVNHSSFLPYNAHLTTTNQLDVTKHRLGTASSTTNLLNIKLAGISLAADDLGYWMRVHSGLLRFVDEGLAGFHLDERGIDIHVELEVGRDRIEELVVLRSARVKIHHLDYKLRKSKFTCLAWFLKLLLRPILRKALESAIKSAIGDGVRALNRELVFARERLRAARVCSPDSLWTFVKAVAARFRLEDNPDVSARVGVKPGRDGVFRGRYAPGSLVRLWEQEAEDAQQNIHEYRRDGWRNDIFSVQTVPL